jgi:hypothetical protein
MASKTAVGGFGGEDFLRLILLLSALGAPIPPRWKAAAAVALIAWKFLR